ncbi:MAG: DUF4388 domain-containing protein [Actinomycetota bacterium]|nr:DUF4388 domain-containing protein [Actinomycetota bacterium]
MDALQGDLDSFSLADVVRLLATAEGTGVLRIERGALTGRVFFVDGCLTYATTRDGDGSVAALARLGTGPERDRRGRNPGGRWPDPARPLILQQISEVLIRLAHGSSGRFWFVEGVETRAYGAEEIERFDAEEVLEAAAARRAEWAKIVRIVPDTSIRFVVRPRLALGVSEVVVDAEAWPILAAIGGGASIQEVAERLNLFELSAAGLVADLYGSGLIVREYGGDSVPSVLVHVESEPA